MLYVLCYKLYYMKLTIAYFGSPQFSADLLEKILTDKDLKKNIHLKMVVTQPDRLAGRKQTPTPTPVKKIAQKNKIKIFTDLSDLNNLTNKINFKNLDLALVYAFGKIIPPSLLNIPKLGFWNIHPSLLPQYRGSSPIAYPLILGKKKTGVTIIKMDEKIDHGPIIDKKSLTITANDYRRDLERKLTDLAFKMVKPLLLKPQNISFQPQNHKKATSTHFLTKNDGFVEFPLLKKIIDEESIDKEKLIPQFLKKYLNQYPKEKDSFFKNFSSSRFLFNLFRGLSPWPGVWTILPNSKRLKIIDLTLEKEKVKILNVQLEGKKEVAFLTFNRAYKFF